MRTKVRDIKKEVFAQGAAKDECHHFWLIESAKGPTSRGVCKVCGATKEFYNAIPEPDSTMVKRHVAFREMPELGVESGRSNES